MAVNGTNLEKAVVAVRNGMDVAKAAQKYGVNPQALANALNPKGGGKPEDGFKKSYDYKFPIGDGKYVKASKIKTVTLKSGRKVEVFKDIEGKTRFQYRAADGKILNETYFKEKEGMSGKHYAINSKGQLVSVKDEADKKFSLPSGNSDNSEWNYAEATNKNLAEAWDMFKKGQMLDAVIKVLNGAENPNKSKYANDSAGMLEFIGGFGIKGGLTFLKQLKNIKSFSQFKTFVSGLMQKAKSVVKEGAANVKTKAKAVQAKLSGAEKLEDGTYYTKSVKVWNSEKNKLETVKLKRSDVYKQKVPIGEVTEAKYNPQTEITELKITDPDENVVQMIQINEYDKITKSKMVHIDRETGMSLEFKGFNKDMNIATDQFPQIIIKDKEGQVALIARGDEVEALLDTTLHNYMMKRIGEMAKRVDNVFDNRGQLCETSTRDGWGGTGYLAVRVGTDNISEISSMIEKTRHYIAKKVPKLTENIEQGTPISSILIPLAGPAAGGIVGAALFGSPDEINQEVTISNSTPIQEQEQEETDKADKDKKQ